MNIVVIISDTLRWDYLGCYGNPKVRTPHLDRFARECVLFERAYAASFPTMPMRADLYTGKFTFTYLGWAPLPREEIILPQLLAEAGYRTMAVVDTPFFVRNGYGYDRGFHDFRWVRGQGGDRADTNYERRYEEDYCAPMTFAAAERWLERHYKEKFFLYVDTWDPHEPWDPPAHYVELYLPEWDGTKVGPPYWYWEERGLTAQQVEIARACYAGEVTMVDRWAGRLIERMESLGLLDKTIIVFTTDHGFYLGEHGMFGKALMQKGRFYGAPLYEEVARVPLLIYVPGVKPRRLNAVVTLPDLMPTLLELVGVEIPDTVQAYSLGPLLRGEARLAHRFVVTTMPLYNPGEVTRVVDNFERRVEEYLPATITAGSWSLLYTREGVPVELYNLREDPQQRENVAKQNRPIAERMHRMFVNFLRKLGTEERLVEPRARL
ncbi:MAG TPA: hypothetical protein EYP85_11710 [Armatimonadetes bacterium]|nr:hypothetical protein [Armatimonadota bacterium]